MNRKFAFFLNRCIFWSKSQRRNARLALREKYYFEDLENTVKSLRGHIGRHTYCGFGCKVESEQTTIGAFGSLGNQILIGAGDHPMQILSTSPFIFVPYKGWRKDSLTGPAAGFMKAPAPCHIGNDVWIGNNVLIRNGVTVGDGAVVGAHSVVTRDVPPYAVVAGVPAKVLRYRFTPEIVEAFVRLKWWDLPDEAIQELPFWDIPTCVKELEKMRSGPYPL